MSFFLLYVICSWTYTYIDIKRWFQFLFPSRSIAQLNSWRSHYFRLIYVNIHIILLMKTHFVCYFDTTHTQMFTFRTHTQHTKSIHSNLNICYTSFYRFYFTWNKVWQLKYDCIGLYNILCYVSIHTTHSTHHVPYTYSVCFLNQ